MHKFLHTTDVLLNAMPRWAGWFDALDFHLRSFVYFLLSGDAMDAPSPRGNEARGILKSAEQPFDKGTHRRLGGSSDGYGISVPKRDKPRSSQTP
jgi:hypothetical protein